MPLFLQDALYSFLPIREKGCDSDCIMNVHGEMHVIVTAH